MQQRGTHRRYPAPVSKRFQTSPIVPHRVPRYSARRIANVQSELPLSTFRGERWDQATSLAMVALNWRSE